MSGSTSYDEDVYTGIWINRSYGSIKGSTLTLDRRSGAFLIAFLALFVGASGRSFWRIVRFILHLSFSAESNLDGLYYQRQAILRNGQLAADAAQDFILARFAWRKKAKLVDRRFLPVAFVAALVAATFTVSGIFSSRVTTGDANEVLISGRDCGNMTYNLPKDNDTEALAVIWADYYSSRTQAASQYLSYAYQCYRNESTTKSKDCEIYTQAKLPYSKTANASCPFDEEMCALPHDNLLLDTGLLDSHNYLGLNSGPRFQFQLTRHCGPLQTTNFTDIYTDESDPSIQWMRYYYGGAFNGTGITPYTYKLRLNDTARSPSDINELMTGEDYTITAPQAIIHLLPQLNRTAAMTSLLWLDSTNVKNYLKVEDPWFKATGARKVPSFASYTYGINLPNNTYYAADDPAGVLGCSSITKLCNPNLPADKRCFEYDVKGLNWTDLWPDAQDQIVMRTHYEFMMNMFDGTAALPDVYYETKGLPALTTRFTLRGLLQPAAIPPNRWQEEAEYMFQTNLAAMQARVVEFAAGRQPPAREAFSTLCNQGIQCRRLCHSQKVRSPTYYSFSVLGIFIIIGLGAAIVLMGSFVEEIFDLIARIPRLAQSRRLKYARIEWHSTTTMQLQRLAHEGVGSGTWSGADKSTPFTQGGELLAPLDISDPHHPRLVVSREMKQARNSHEAFVSDEEELLKAPGHAVYGLDKRTQYRKLSTDDHI